jgi:hypothetical protein
LLLAIRLPYKTVTAAFEYQVPWPSVRLPMSVATSVVIHVAALVIIGVMLRAMPATVGMHSDALPNLTANIVALPPLNDSPYLPQQPQAPEQPLREMMLPPVVPSTRHPPAPG